MLKVEQNKDECFERLDIPVAKRLMGALVQMNLYQGGGFEIHPPPEFFKRLSVRAWYSPFHCGFHF